MRSFYTLSLWLLLGTLAGYGFLSFIGLVEKNDNPFRVFNFEKSSSSVVNIWSLRRWREWQEKSPSLGLRRWKQVIKTGFFPDGSGVIFDNNGHIITNLHVLDSSIQLKQKLLIELYDGSNHEVEIIGTDRENDLAVLKIIEKNIDVFPIQREREIEDIKIGETVYAIGNPQGLGQSVSMGIVSAIGRKFINKRGSFIQTDASINPGNSGGALVDSEGNLLGIINFIESTTGGNQGLNFAIPIDVVSKSYSQILRDTKIN
tara:strand:- start:458 stop:1237 length:780 start_codon:yes stop_codon:yes gene_type:complete